MSLIVYAVLPTFPVNVESSLAVVPLPPVNPVVSPAPLC